MFFFLSRSFQSALPLLFIVIGSVVGNGQEMERKFGDVRIPDFQAISADTSAAIVLFDVGKLVMDVYTGTKFRRHLRYKVLRPGHEEFGGNFEVLLPRNSLRRPRAVTYNLDGGMITASEVSNTAVMKKRYDNDYDLVVITMPNIKSNSIVELEYVMDVRAFYMLPWHFQHSVPTLWSEYSIHSYTEQYSTIIRGEIKPTNYETKYNGKYQHWVMTDLPAFSHEPLMPDEDVYLASVRFRFEKTTWEQAYSVLRTSANLWGQAQPNVFFDGIIQPLITDRSDSLGTIKALSDYVKSAVAFNGSHDFIADDIKTVLKNKTGTVADINTFLAALLRQAGFQVSMVLLSTRDHGYILREFPGYFQFNYVVCMVQINGKDLLLDATDKMLSYDMLPEKCFNHQGFFIGEHSFGWISVEPTVRHRSAAEVNLKINIDGSMEGKIAFRKSGYTGSEARTLFADVGQEKYVEKFVEKTGWQVSASNFEGLTDVNKPFVEEFEVSISNAGFAGQGLIYVDPYVIMKTEKNPFTLPQRKYPVDLDGIIDEQVITNILVPEGYELDKMPENKIFALPENAGRCSFNFSLVGNRVSVSTRFLLNKTLFQPDEYLNLREFYARIISKRQEQLVFKQKL